MLRHCGSNLVACFQSYLTSYVPERLSYVNLIHVGIMVTKDKSLDIFSEVQRAHSLREFAEEGGIFQPLNEGKWHTSDKVIASVSTNIADEKICVHLLAPSDASDSDIAEGSEHFQDNAMVAIGMQAALRFHARSICKLSSSVMLLAGRVILTRSGAWRFHNKVTSYITPQDWLTIAFFLCGDLFHLIAVTCIVMGKPLLCGLVSQELKQLYEAKLFQGVGLCVLFTVVHILTDTFVARFTWGSLCIG